MRKAIAGICALVLSSAFAPQANADSFDDAGLRTPHSRGRVSAVWTGTHAYMFGGDKPGTNAPSTDEITRLDPVTGHSEVIRARLPQTLGDTSAIWDGTHAYIFGGRWSDRIYRFSPGTETIETMEARFPLPILGTAAAWDGQRYAYIFGGLSCTDLPCSYSRRIYRYEPATDTLIDIKSMPYLGFASAVWNDGVSFIFGGRDAYNWSDKVYRFDPVAESFTTVATLPSPRARTSSVVVGDSAYVIGGQTAFWTYVGDVIRFDLNASTVTHFGQIAPTHGTASVFDGSKILVLGGFTRDVQVVDPADEWMGKLGRLPSTRHSPATVTDGQLVYAFGGHRTSVTYPWPTYVTVHLDEVVRYDPATRRVEVMEPRLPKALGGASAVWAGDHALLLGGRGSDGRSETIYRFDPSGSFATVTATTLPYGLEGAGAVWDGSAAYLFGGRNDDGNTSTILRYDPSSTTVTAMAASLPFETAGTSAVWDGEFAWIVGLGDLILRYDPVSDEIRTMSATLPSTTWGMGAAFDGRDVYVFGGASSQQISRYVRSEDRVILMDATLPDTIHQAGVTWADGSAYVIGGRTDTTSYSSVIYRYTREPGPPLSPEAVAGPDAGEITVTWSPPKENSYAIAPTGYRVWVHQPGDNVRKLLAELPASATSFVHSGLGAGAVRHYEVTAFNPDGESPFSALRSAASSVPPHPPRVSGSGGPGSGQITLELQPPLYDGGLEVTGYRVYRGTRSNPHELVAEIGATTTFVDSGLSSDKLYSYSVSAINPAGEGEPSEPIELRPYGPPGQPREPRAIPNPVDQGIYLYWYPPYRDGGSAVNAYRVYRSVNGAPAQLIATVPDGFYRDGNCEIADRCVYEITALNAFGVGPTSSKVVMYGVRL